MKYLVLQRFRTLGKLLEKGDVVDESEIRSPLLRRSEGKIIPAVSSSVVPGGVDTEDVDPQAHTVTSDDKGDPDSAEGAGLDQEPAAEHIEEPEAKAENDPATAAPSKPKVLTLKFR